MVLLDPPAHPLQLHIAGGAGRAAAAFPDFHVAPLRIESYITSVRQNAAPLVVRVDDGGAPDATLPFPFSGDASRGPTAAGIFLIRARGLTSPPHRDTFHLMRVHAPAKINLFLRVGRRRADGFHPLVSWMCTVALRDTIDLRPAPPGRIILRCDRPDVPVDAGNLIVRAAEELWAGGGGPNRPRPGVRIELTKRIAMGAGLGGGSSDAAATLIALNRLWDFGCSSERLAAIGAHLGSDVPFFFHAPSALVRGRGEIVQATPRPRARAVLLILPQAPLATAEVYARFDAMGLGRELDEHSEPNAKQWAALGARDLMEVLFNDLEPAAFALAPRLGELHCELERALGRPLRMSGSGSSLFSLYDDLDEAQAAAARAHPADAAVLASGLCHPGPSWA